MVLLERKIVYLNPAFPAITLHPFNLFVHAQLETLKLRLLQACLHRCSHCGKYLGWLNPRMS